MKKRVTILIAILAMGVSMLVAQTNNSHIKKTTPTSDFTVHNNGTVTHKKTGLMWKVASEGQSWNSDGTVMGSVQHFTWAEAKNRAIAVNAGTEGQNCGFTDWRVPTIKELSSIVERASYDPSINLEIFPATGSICYWSATADANYSDYAWIIYFYSGYDYHDNKDNDNYVRLVRARQ